MGTSYSERHAASLLSQLPRDSRIVRAACPDAEWDDGTYMLHSMEESLRLIVWSKTKDAQMKRNVPEPVPTPGELARKRKRIENTDKDFVDKVLGMR